MVVRVGVKGDETIGYRGSMVTTGVGEMIVVVSIMGAYVSTRTAGEDRVILLLVGTAMKVSII